MVCAVVNAKFTLTPTVESSYVTVSIPTPPSSVSLPRPPFSVSLPSPARMILFRVFPFSVSS